MIISGQLNLKQLESELGAAGVLLSGLVLSGSNLWIVSSNGQLVEPSASAASIIAAHVPLSTLDPFEQDALAIETATTLAALKTAVATLSRRFKAPA